MTVISSISATQPLTVAKVATSVPVGHPAESTVTVSSPSSIVTLLQDNKAIDAQTYTSRGVIAELDAPLSWEYTQHDKVSLHMRGNFGNSSTAGRFQNLGASLLLQLAETNKNISQSVIRSSTGRPLEAAELAAAQAKLHSGVADNSISFTLKTASGKTVQLTLSSQDNALAVQAQVEGGDLSKEELAALGAMADGFESAIQGLTAVPPQLKLDALMQFDSKVFSSVDLVTRFKLSDDSTQTLDLRADASQRRVRMSGAAGALNIGVDLKNAAILGNSTQKAKALESYLRQIEAARDRGDGDQRLLSMFESAFKTVHSNYSESLAATVQQPPGSNHLTDTDRSLLSGLADFNATVTEKTVNGNPARPGELDSFSYDLSQSTQSKGLNRLNRTLVQNQQSHLTAQYHKPLYAGQKLELTTDSESQNYRYYQINDQASSTSRIGYVEGEMVEASVSHSASQSTRISKYIKGHLEEDNVIPASSSKTQNFLVVLQQALEQDKAATLGRGTSLLEYTLATIQGNVMLISNPSELKG
ncbi:lactate dehydrogenase [Pseudomonas sp. NPDC099000]|uniref:lactate dehydrogenase n=1 Tax=Pseudomonas sp. NPDC099000 TaxID=3364488 RepID=UPI00383A1A16